MTFTCFDLEQNGGVSHLRLTRPDKRNSMIPEFWTELAQAMDEIESSGRSRVLVISSTGPHFTAGMDLSVFQSGQAVTTDSGRDRERLRRLVLSLQSTFTRLEQSRIPVIAAIQGGCIGGGVDMVCACDLRYATKSAFFCIEEINIGIMADLGTLQRLPKLIPEGIVRELAYTGDRLSAERALAIGLVNEVFDTPEEMLKAALVVAGKIAAHPPLAIAGTKEAITYSRDHPVAESLRQAANWQAAMLDVNSMRESFQAKSEKREPSFVDLAPCKVSL